MFSAVLIHKKDDGQSVETSLLDEASLPEGDVAVDVSYSTLNYKDGLAITGKAPVVRSFPMIPGIDFAGVVTQSAHARRRFPWPPGFSTKRSAAVWSSTSTRNR